MAATLFVALVPPPEILAPLAGCVSRLRTEPELARLAWVAPQRWHVTVCFLGAVQADPALAARLGAVASRHQPPALSLEGAGHFGRRVLFANVTGDLASLAADAAEAAASAGYPPPDRTFSAHLTVARGRGRAMREGDLRPAVQALAALPRMSWVPTELLLMAGDQPAYRRVASWPFGAR